MKEKKLFVLFLFIYCASVLLAASYMSYYNRAEKFYQSGEYDKAIDYYRNSYKANKKFFKAYRKIFYCYEKKGDMTAILNEATAFFKNSGFVDVDNKAFIFAFQAKAYSSKNDIMNAQMKIDKAIKIVSNTSDKKMYEKIRKDVFNKKKEYFDSEFKKAKSFYNSGNSNKALSILQSVLRIDRSDSRIVALYTKIKSENARKKRKAELDKLIMEAKNLESQNKWEEAKYKWDEIVVMGGNDFKFDKQIDEFKARWKSYNLKVQQERNRKQIELSLKRKIKMLSEKAISGFKNEEWRSAYDALRKLRKIQPGVSRWEKMYKKTVYKLRLLKKMKKGLVLIEKQEFEQGVSLLTEVHNVDKNSRRITDALAKAYFALKKYDKVIELLSEYLSHKKPNRKNMKMYKLLSICYIKTKQFEKAQVALNEYVLFNKSDADAKYILADLYIDSEKFEKAETHLKSFAKIEEQSPRAFNKYLKLYKAKYKKSDSKSNFDILVNTYKRRISMFIPDNKEYRKLSYELGKLFYERSKFPEAYVYFQNALLKMKPSEEINYPEIKTMYNKCWFMRYIIYFHIIGGILLIVILRIIWVTVLEPIISSIKEGRKEKLKTAIKKFKTQKKFDKIVVAAKEIIAKFPLNVSESKQIHSELAEAYMELGKFDDAEKEAKDLLKLERNFVSAHRIIASVYFKRGEYPQAISQCRLVFDFDVAETSIHSIFQNSYKALNNKEELIMEYEDMIQMNPDNINLRNIYLKLQNEFLTDSGEE